MNTQKQLVTVRDLVEEAKKRVVILAVCVVGLSYLMSLTSSSVWVNLPAAACLIILVRYFALDLEMKKKAAVYNSKPSSVNESSLKKHPEFPKSAPRSDWRSKVNSQVVEDAINHFTRHLVSEWVTDLWYSRITPDKEGPEELVQIINGVFGEFSSRFRNLNLIDLLTRDLIHIICRHLELFRSCQAKIEKQNQRTLTIEGREVELRRVMAAENKLHPALFSSESEHKVLQHLVAGLISFTFRHEDLQCAYFRFTVRELLACCVLRPVLNLANPRFINERIEVAVKSKMRVQKRIGDTQETPESDDLTSILPDHFSRHLDPSITGVELVQLKNEQDRTAGGPSEANLKSGADLSKDPLLSIDTRSSRSWNSYPINSKATNDRGNNEGGEWCDVLDLMSRRKTETLEPDNLESVWAKGRNYKRKEDEKKFTKQVPEGLSFNKVITANNPKEDSHRGDNNSKSTLDLRDSGKQKLKDPAASLSNHLAGHPCQADDEQVSVQSENAQVESSSSYTSEEEEPDNATGLSTLGTKVWDGRANRNLGVAHIHHPLESCASFKKKSSRGHTQYQKFQRNQSGRKRSRVSNQNLSVWQEVERTSVLPGDDKDILGYTQGHVIGDDATDDSDTEYTGRAFSGVSSSSSGSFFSLPDQGTFTGNSLKSSLMVDSFAKLRCQVLGANIVESGSKIFAVYSVSVADESNHSWSVKRRFRHFEELHRRLKEFQEYNLHLPPKHFLSTGLDIPVIQERCILLDSYLKKLLQLPRVSGSIEVWDFLSVDSQTYAFSSSFSIIDTLSVKVDHKPSGRSNNISNITGPVAGSLASRSEDLSNGNGLKTKDVISQVKIPGKEHIETSDPDLKTGKESGGSKKSYGVPDSVNDPTLPTEWVPPKLTVPLLDLVDVVLNLQEGGWIRRKAFWVAKQVLQLGMGDALDDWLLEKIRLLRRGSVVASGVQRVEQILWPDGIFITKHPKRQQQQQESHPPRATSLGSHTQQTDDISSPRLTDEEQHKERAKFVYELMINKAPATVVSLVGRMEYEHCAKDLYFFLQSSVCLKQLAFDLLELLLLSAFPEMDRLFKEIHEEKHKFGDFEAN